MDELIKALREDQKRITARLADKGGVTVMGKGTLKAMLSLRDES